MTVDATGLLEDVQANDTLNSEVSDDFYMEGLYGAIPGSGIEPIELDWNLRDSVPGDAR